MPKRTRIKPKKTRSSKASTPTGRFVSRAMKNIEPLSSLEGLKDLFKGPNIRRKQKSRPTPGRA